MFQQQLVDAARTRLREIKQQHPGLFARMCAAAHGERNPVDYDGILRDPRGVIFTTEDGTWLPGYRELVVALTAVDSTDELDYVVLDTPPLTVSAWSEAA